ncbi:UAA transporter [Lambiella insularis]|nr:UAA transporter [Lambiella insularis]
MASAVVQLSHTCSPDLNDSPTTTPFQTRVPSPMLGNLIAHQQLHGEEAVSRIRSSFNLRESQKVAVGMADGSAEVPAAVKYKYLACYFLFNLGLTLFNKAIMNEFPYPYLMTAHHAFTAWIGTSVLLSRGYFTLSQVGGSKVKLHGFSLLYTINIAISNASLAMVTVPFHQVVRATSPAFTILIYREVYGGIYTKEIYLSLIPVIAGVGLATYGDYYATTGGFLLTILGAFLASAKTVATNRLQTAGLHLSSLELLHRMSFLAFPQALAMSIVAGEINIVSEKLGIQAHIGTTSIDVVGSGLKIGLILLVNGAMAFGLNVISFMSNKKVGALTMTVAGNVKQIIAVVLSVVFWNLKISTLNAIGIALTLAGGLLYAHVSMRGNTRLPNSDIEKAEEK